MKPTITQECHDNLEHEIERAEKARLAFELLEEANEIRDQLEEQIDVVRLIKICS